MKDPGFSNMSSDDQGWAKILPLVKTELALLALIVLVVGAFFGTMAIQPGVEKATLVAAFSSIVVLLIVVAGAVLVYRTRTTYLERVARHRNFARGLGEEIYKAVDGAIQNSLPTEQEEAYETLYDYVTTSRYIESNAERLFVTELVETVMRNAGLRSKVSAHGKSTQASNEAREIS